MPEQTAPFIGNDKSRWQTQYFNPAIADHSDFSLLRSSVGNRRDVSFANCYLDLQGRNELGTYHYFMAQYGIDEQVDIALAGYTAFRNPFELRHYVDAEQMMEGEAAWHPEQIIEYADLFDERFGSAVCEMYTAGWYYAAMERAHGKPAVQLLVQRFPNQWLANYWDSYINARVDTGIKPPPRNRQPYIPDGYNVDAAVIQISQSSWFGVDLDGSGRTSDDERYKYDLNISWDMNRLRVTAPQATAQEIDGRALLRSIVNMQDKKIALSSAIDKHIKIVRG